MLTSMQDRLTRPGCYVLIINLAKEKIVRVGKLGSAKFPPGIYLYTGRAMNGLRVRLSHHLKRRKKKHWHVDYLLQCPKARIERILIAASPVQECNLNRRVMKLSGARAILKGFGSSDCVSGCGSHLVYFGRRLHQHVRTRSLRSREGV